MRGGFEYGREGMSYLSSKTLNAATCGLRLLHQSGSCNKGVRIPVVRWRCAAALS